MAKMNLHARLWRLWQIETSFACNLACVMCPWKGIREQSKGSSLMDASVWAALRFIHDNAGRSIQAPDVVAETGLSRRSLERRFAAAIGRTILDELTRCRVDRAKRLLLETDLSIERVALAAGFSAAKRMTHAFRQLEGTLPYLYRQMHE